MLLWLEATIPGVTAAEVSSLVAARFLEGPFQAEGSRPDIEVRVRELENGVQVTITGSNEVLAARLKAAWPEAQLRVLNQPDEEAAPALSFAVAPHKNLSLFRRELEGLPSFIRQLFPLVGPDRARVELRRFALQPPETPTVSTRYIVWTELALFDSGGVEVSCQPVALCNFFGPDPEGIIRRPGRPSRSAIDDEMARFRASVQRWLASGEVLRRIDTASASRSSVETVFAED